MSALVTTPNIERPDSIYELLIAAHEGLDGDQSLRLSARLILLLANHIGNEDVIREAIIQAVTPSIRETPPFPGCG